MGASLGPFVAAGVGCMVLVGALVGLFEGAKVGSLELVGAVVGGDVVGLGVIVGAVVGDTERVGAAVGFSGLNSTLKPVHRSNGDESPCPNAMDASNLFCAALISDLPVSCVIVISHRYIF